MQRPYPSLRVALEACGLRCHITKPIPPKGFLRVHAEGDRSGSQNVAIARCGTDLGYLKYWKKDISVLFRLNESEIAIPASSPTADINASHLIRALLKNTPIAKHSTYFSEKKLSIIELKLRCVTPKELSEHYGYRLLGRSTVPFVVIPIYRIESRQPKLCSGQLIGGTPTRKHFLKGGQKKGGFWLVKPIPRNETAPVIGVAEGVATAISAWELFKHQGHLTTVAAAFDCGNLLPVCKSLRKRWPKAQIIVFADNDCPETDLNPNQHCSPNNAGVNHAIKACRAVGARLHAPSFDETALMKFKGAKGTLPTDWNDYLCSIGVSYGK